MGSWLVQTNRKSFHLARMESSYILEPSQQRHSKNGTGMSAERLGLTTTLLNAVLKTLGPPSWVGICLDLLGASGQMTVGGVGGGAHTIQQFMELGLLDEIHVAQIPIELNYGEVPFSNMELQLHQYRAVDPIIQLKHP